MGMVIWCMGSGLAFRPRCLFCAATLQVRLRLVGEGRPTWEPMPGGRGGGWWPGWLLVDCGVHGVSFHVFFFVRMVKRRRWRPQSPRGQPRVRRGVRRSGVEAWDVPL